MENGIHVRSKHTGRYLNSGGSWSALRSDARLFPTAIEARNWCVQAKLANVEIVIFRDALIYLRVPMFEGD
jgi:hypothetical protein